MARKPPPRRHDSRGPGGSRGPLGAPRRPQALARWGPRGDSPPPPDQNSADLCARGALEKIRRGHRTLAGLVLPLSDWNPGCMLADVLCAGLLAAPRLLVPVCLLPACRRLVCPIAGCPAPAPRPPPSALSAAPAPSWPARRGLTCPARPLGGTPTNVRGCRKNPPSSPPRLRVMGLGLRCMGSPGPRDLALPGLGSGMTQARSIGTRVTRVLVPESGAFSYGPVR